MYYILVYGMYACYTCTDIMHASYYSVCIDEYTVLLTYNNYIHLNNFQVIALLEMVCITYQYMVCMHTIYVLILCMHPITVHVYR